MSMKNHITEALLMAYHNNELEETEKRTVATWIAETSANRLVYLDLVKVWEHTAKLKPQPIVVDTNLAWENVKNKINQTPKSGMRIRLKPFLQIAAIFTLMVAGFFVWKSNLKKDTILLAGIDKVNTVLADGSKVSLNANSKITIDKNFEKKERSVSLVGEAFFEVNRDTTSPFIVYMPDQTFVKVLGTSFNIDNSKHKTTVYVKSGKVEFGTKAESLILTKGQKAIYDHQTKSFESIMEALNESTEIYWLDEKLNFEGETLENILATLANIFHSKIELKCQEAKNYPIVSSHHGESLTEILTIICTVHQLKMEIIEGDETTYILKCDE